METRKIKQGDKLIDQYRIFCEQYDYSPVQEVIVS